MPEQTAAEPTPSEIAELRAQLAEREAEVLRLRDLLIGKDAELGELRGRQAMAEESARRLTGAAARLPIPGSMRVTGLLIRLLQNRRS